MNQKTTKADMKLLEKGFIHPSNHTEVMYDIPLTFKLGEKTVHGIPDKIGRASCRERV